jgi:hypothetical protein
MIHLNLEEIFIKANKIFTILFVTISLTANAQNRSVRIKEQALEVVKAALENDYETILSHTYPRLIELVNGHKKMNTMISDGMDSLKAHGIWITDISLGKPGKVFKAGKELHCIISERIVMQIKGGHMIINSNLLAISKDKGRFWYFLECRNKEDLLQIVPEFNKKFIFPEKQDPIIIKE